MKKKLILSAVVFTMMIFSACGIKKEPTAKDVIKKVVTVEPNSFSQTINARTPYGNVVVALDGRMKSDKKEIDVSVKLKSEILNSEDTYPVTKIIYDENDNTYIGVSEILSFLCNVDSQYAILGAYFKFPGDYLVITKEDVINTIKEQGIEEFDEEVFRASNYSDIKLLKYATLVINTWGSFVDELDGKLVEDAITVNDNSIVMTINNENVSDYINALSEMDIETYLADYAKAADEIFETTIYTEQIGSQLEGLNDAIKEASEKVSSTDMSELIFDVKMNIISSDNKEASIIFDFSMTHDDETMAIATECKLFNQEVEEIKIPESTMSLKDIEEMSSLIGVE